MTVRSENYAKVLYSLQLSNEVINQTKQLLQSKELVEALSNPAVRKNEKVAVIDALFPESIRSYMKAVCLNECMDDMPEIFECYEEIRISSANKLRATFVYVTKPDDDDLNGIREMLKAKYKKEDVEFVLKEDASLIGGFVLKVGDIEYDKSIKGTLEELQKNLVRR